MSEPSLGPHPVTQAVLRLLPKGTVAAQYRADQFARESLRAEQLKEAISEELTIESLFDQISSSEEVGEMFRVAVESASRSTSEGHIRLLGKFLAAGALAADQARVDEADQLLRVTAQLDPVDLRALLVLEGKLQQRRNVTPMHCLKNDMGFSSALSHAIFARLTRLGLLSSERSAYVADADATNREDDAIEIEEIWSVTPTAEAILEMLGGRRA